MALNTAQLSTLKAFILADPTLNAFPMNSDGAYEIAKRLNLAASPAFIVWKTSVPIKEVGENMNSSEVSGLTTANTNRLSVLGQYSGNVFNPARADTRAAFDSIFSGTGGQLTRAALAILWKRSATVGEKLFATGTGSDASPATLVVEGAIAYQEVEAARAM